MTLEWLVNKTINVKSKNIWSCINYIALNDFDFDFQVSLATTLFVIKNTNKIECN